MTQNTNDLEQHLEALQASLSSGDPKGVAEGLGNLGRAASAAGRRGRAVLYFETALTLHRAIGDGWGTFLDLLTQGEELLGMPNQLVTALACYTLAHEAAIAIDAPEAEKVKLRVESVIGQISDKLPEQGEQLRKVLAEDAEMLRAQGVQLLLDQGPLAAAFFDDQLSVARLMGDAGGVFLSLGSQAKVLTDGEELAGALAALQLAEAASKTVQGLSKDDIKGMLAEWKQGLEEAATSRGTTTAALREEVREGLEAARADAMARLRADDVPPERGDG